MKAAPLAPGFHFGAVYFRKSNPPREDWERDYAIAAQDGHTLFRHWVPWNAVEVAPGEFDWADYDRHLELAAQFGLRVVLAEMLVDFPEWLVAAYPEARIETRHGARRTSEMHVSSLNGGHHALCLDHPAIEEAARRFLTALGTRYRDNDTLLGYDIWNECTYYSDDRLPFNQETEARFVQWLQQRYDLETLKKRWGRLSLTSWEQVRLPRQFDLYPDVLDAMRFQADHAASWMAWRREVLKAADPNHLVIAHGNSRSWADIAPCAGDDFRAAKEVELFGYTHYVGQGGTQLLAVDTTRGAADGKAFWRAEAVGHSKWNLRRLGVPNPARDWMSDPDNIRFDALISMVGGASAYQNPRWRPLLDGPLFGSYGWYGMDGERTPRSEAVKELAQWAHSSVQALWNSQPARGDVGLLLLEDSQAWVTAFYGSSDVYALCFRGAHAAFNAAHLATDIIKPAQINDYGFVYAPLPVALSDADMTTLLEWVEAGGRLVLEGCAGYFNEAAHAFPRQPSRGLREAAGVREIDVSFAIDAHDVLGIETSSGVLPARIFRQSFEANSQAANSQIEVIGRWPDGTSAITRHSYGEGFITLVGSMPSAGIERGETGELGLAAWLDECFKREIGDREVRYATSGVLVRRFEGEGGHFVWLLNPGFESVDARIELAPELKIVSTLRGEKPRCDGGVYAARIAGRDAAIWEVKIR